MCLIALGWQAHPDFPLVVVANRDEFFERPTEAAHWWPDRPGLLAGRDQSAGGTWLGITRDGHFAALTNYRDPLKVRDDAQSRGALVVDALAYRDAQQAAEQIHARRADFNPFNLLVADRSRIFVVESESNRQHELEPGIHALSNHLLNSPWPKVEQARHRLGQALAGALDMDALAALLRDDRPAPDAALPSTGVSLTWERLLSSAFIRAPGYGTRSTTTITIDRQGECRFIEQTWDTTGQEARRQTHRFTITAGPDAGA